MPAHFPSPQLQCVSAWTASPRKGRPAGRAVRRSWKSTDAAAAAQAFFTKPRRTAVRELIQTLCSSDPFDHRCAAELARLVSRRQPGILAGYADLLAEVAAALPMEEWQARGYVLVAAAHNARAASQRRRLLPLVRARMEEDRIAVRAMALEAFSVLAAAEPSLRDEALTFLEAARRSSIPAMRCRAKLMLPVIMKVETADRSRPRRQADQ